jgi:hypothetical protein
LDSSEQAELFRFGSYRSDRDGFNVLELDGYGFRFGFMVDCFVALAGLEELAAFFAAIIGLIVIALFILILIGKIEERIAAAVIGYG